MPGQSKVRSACFVEAMAWFQRLLGAALILLGVATSGGARAQIPDAIQADPAALVTKVSLALQTGDLLTVYRWFDSDLVAATLSRTGGTAIDSRLALLCTNMKNAGIVIYTVRVEVTTGSSSLLRNCATTPDKFYDVQSASNLTAVFSAIAGSIENLRITQ